MKILARVRVYLPEHRAGAEMMLHELLRTLAHRGHDCQVWLSAPTRRREPQVIDGVRIHPRNDQVWLEALDIADLLITHLGSASYAVSAGIAMGKPVVQLLHNTYPPTRLWASQPSALLVANSEWLAAEFGNPQNMITVRPPVRSREYRVDTTGADRITLINLSQGKGGVLFAQLAAMMRGKKFLGVQGAYGEQIDVDLPNVEILDHASVPMTEVYARTRVLLMPSSYESWGRTGVEAMCSGIPVIAHPTPGLRESLDHAGVFVDRRDIYEWVRAVDVVAGDGHRKYSDACRDRALELDPSADLGRWVEAIERIMPARHDSI